MGLSRQTGGMYFDQQINMGKLQLLNFDFFPEITHQDLKYVEACLRCLRTIFKSNVAPTDIVYQVKYYAEQIITVTVILFTGGSGRHPRADTTPLADTPSQQMAIVADSTHPTGMHSCSCVTNTLISAENYSFEAGGRSNQSSLTIHSMTARWKRNLV